MIEIKGSHTSALVFSEELDEASMAQIYQICNQESMQAAKIAIMPDVHMGSSCCVGTTIQLKDKIIPSLVGVDIGCGMEVVTLKETNIELSRLDAFIHQHIPSGSDIRKKAHKAADQVALKKLYCYKNIQEERAKASLGTLGGGNHFIEVDRGEDKTLYLIIHSGSRHLGVEVATYYQKLAFDRLNGSDEKAIEELKKQGQKATVWKQRVTTLKNTKKTAVPYLLCYLQGADMEAYLHDMAIVQEYAAWNRRVMADDIIAHMKLHVIDRFTTIHNYVDMEAHILRKGAISARKDELVLIPMNMRDGALLCKGKGNPLWNYSAPHGAGRRWSRSEAKQRVTLSEYKKAMEDIYSTCVIRSTLDESPMAYKDAKSIQTQITDCVEIVQVLKPIYNFKAGKEA